MIYSGQCGNFRGNSKNLIVHQHHIKPEILLPTLFHIEPYFLSQIGKQGDIEQAFQRFTQAYQALPSPTLTEQVNFLTAKMLHSLLLEHDITNAEKMRQASIELVANQPAGKLDEQYVNLYFGYGLCFLQNQTGAEYIDIVKWIPPSRQSRIKFKMVS